MKTNCKRCGRFVECVFLVDTKKETMANRYPLCVQFCCIEFINKLGDYKDFDVEDEIRHFLKLESFTD